MTALSPFSGSPVSVHNDINEIPIVVAQPKAPTKSKTRKRVNTAEKRHQHNAIERQRRETLNGKFLSLARLLPSLASHRRPSKSAIVNGSIHHLTHQRDQRLLAAKLLRRLCTEHDELLGELNEWRKANGFALKESIPALAEEVDQVCSVEKEVFGNFATMGGEGDDDDDDDNMPNEMSLDQAAAVAASFSHVDGLITPRSSTEIDAMAHSQAMFGNMPVLDKHPNPATATVNGMNWSNSFAYNVNSTSVRSSTSSLPFSAFVSDPFDQSSSGSPTNSQPGVVCTPPMTGDMSAYTHTPSPRSSAAGTEEKVVPSHPPTNAWSAQQMLYLAQQQHLQQPVHLAQAQSAAYNRASAGHPSGMFPPATQQQLQGQNYGADPFTQSLLANMFPQNAATSEQVQQWRKVALGGLVGQQQHQHQQHQQQAIQQGRQPSLDELKVRQLHSIRMSR